MSTREIVTQALFDLLTSSIATSFTGTASYGSPIITGIADTAGLFVGMPTTSSRTPATAAIASVDGPTQVTLTEAAQSAGTVQFTTGFRTTSRRLRMPNDVAAQPALFLRNESEDVSPRSARMPMRLTMRCEAWIYSRAGTAADAVPGATLNHILDAITRVLEPLPGRELQTLGGLAHHCWIEGQVELHPGDLDGQALAIIPISILVPDPT